MAKKQQTSLFSIILIPILILTLLGTIIFLINPNKTKAEKAKYDFYITINGQEIKNDIENFSFELHNPNSIKIFYNSPDERNFYCKIVPANNNFTNFYVFSSKTLIPYTSLGVLSSGFSYQFFDDKFVFIIDKNLSEILTSCSSDYALINPVNYSLPLYEMQIGYDDNNYLKIIFSVDGYVTDISLDKTEIVF